MKTWINNFLLGRTRSKGINRSFNEGQTEIFKRNPIKFLFFSVFDADLLLFAFFIVNVFQTIKNMKPNECFHVVCSSTSRF